MFRLARAAAVTLAVLGFSWAGWLMLVGGGTINLLGLKISSNEPLRPFTIGCVALAGFVLLGGRLPAWSRRRPSDRVQAIGLSLAVTLFGVAYATTAGVGSDPYGYVSQADLWIARDLHVEQPLVAQAPWPSKASSFAPLGYRPTSEDGTLVPTYPSGLALLMAGAKIAGGQEAMFWLVPLAGGLLVLATYGTGRRLAPPGAAIVAAWLLATCPAMLYMLVQPMSDVPVAAAWMGAAYFLLRNSTPAAVMAGLAAALAVLIRPNLVFLVPVFAAWPLWLTPEHEARSRAKVHALVFCGCASLGVIAVLATNQHLYGSAFEFGHGDPGALFGLSHFVPSFMRYGSWLIESQTIASLGGLAALFIPSKRLWPDVERRRLVAMAAATMASVWLFYCFYLVFDEWWYLRFMLPALPFIAMGTGAIVIALRNAAGNIPALAAIGLVLVVMAQYRFAASHGVTEFWRSERRYVGVAKLVAGRTPAESVIFSLQHSGSMRYYGGRTTIRFDNLDGHSLDEAVAWLSGRGIRSYLVLEEWETSMFRDRFAGQAALARLQHPVAIITDGRFPAALYDLTAGGPGVAPEIPNPVEGLRSTPPAAR